MLTGKFMSLRRRDSLPDVEQRALENAISEVRTYEPRRVLVRAGERLTNSTLLLDGVVCRSRELVDGKRQLLAFHIAGDFIDLHGFLLKALEHDMVSMTSVDIALIPHEALRAITETHAHLTRLLWFSTLVDAAIHREWIAARSMGAQGRIAHLLCELQIRMELVGLANRRGFDLPLTQIDLADATGLTAVHVNRTLRRLREAGIAEFAAGRVTIHDLDALWEVAAFDPSYLYLEQDEV